MISARAGSLIGNMKTVAMLSEPVASKELKDGVYEVWVTAEAQYDDARSELQVDLDSFVRPTDIRLKDVRIDAEWLPKKGRVAEHVSSEEAHDQTKEIFESWVRKVRRHIPQTFDLGKFKAEKFQSQEEV
jgi:hypothetical protein